MSEIDYYLNIFKPQVCLVIFVIILLSIKIKLETNFCN